MTHSPSLTRRLIWTLTLGAVVLWLATALLTASTLRARLDDAFDGGLRETAERLLPLAVDGLGADGDEPAGREAHEVPLFDGSGGEYIVYQVRLGDGSVLLRSHDSPTDPFPVPLRNGFADSGPWRIYTIGSPRQDIYIQVGEAVTHRADSLWSSVLALLLPITVLVPLSALGIFFAVRRGLQPVGRFSVDIESRHGSNLSPVDASQLPIELQPIADAVNGLIERVRTALEAERVFAANSAHELRTPIAGSLAQTQRLIAELGDNPAVARARQVEESLVRLRQLSEKLLQLSRADAGIGYGGASTNLLPALRLVIEDARHRIADGSRLRLNVKDGMTLTARMDVDAFGIALRNLIDNALLHGAPDEPIEVTVEPGMVEVSNGGPSISPDTLAGLTQRFARGQTRAPGSGLGLAIVDTLMRQTGGRLELRSPAPGRDRGFAARLVFQAAA